TPTGGGYWLLSSDGVIYPFHASGHGSYTLGGGKTFVGMASTPDGGGYWLLSSNGGIYAYGDAHFQGDASLTGKTFVGMASTPDGGGYWLLSSNGGIYAYGDAHFQGDGTSTGKTFVAISATFVPSSTTLSCPSSGILGPPTPCMAIVAGSSPTGTVTFNLISGSGSFITSTCTLAPMGDGVHSLCAGAFQATAAGTASMSATYSGDSSNAGSTSATVTLTIKKATTFTSVVCSPPDVASPSQSITCTATVNFLSAPGIPTPTGSVTFSGSPNILTFTPSGGQCAISGSPFPSCSVSFTASQSASVGITATYGGDSNYASSSGNSVVGEGLTPSTVTVNGCTSPLAATPGTCTVTVTGSSPTGLVFFPPTNPVSGPPPFYVPPGCTLSTVSSTTSQCTMTFVDVTPNTSPTVMAVYPGDANNGPSSGTATVTIGAAPTINSLSVSCTPTTVIMGSPTTCTATVTPSTFTGYVFLTAGTIGVTGLPPMTPLMPLFQFCQVSAGSCSVGFIGAIPGETYVNAYLPGITPVQTTTQITVNLGSGSNTMNSGMGDQTFEGGPLTFASGMPCATPTACGSISFTPPSGDAGDQFATTFRLLDGTDSGVGSSDLGNTQYGDISITSTSGGGSSSTLVNVCLPDTSADSNTILQYWDTTTSSWVTATNIVVTPGVKVCGDMPLSALNGRNIIGGDPLATSGPPPAIVYGNVTWYTPTYQGFQYVYPASVAINGKQFSSTFYESLIAQFQLVPGQQYAGYYQGTFGAISGCQEGATITITATVNGMTESTSALCPAPGNSTSISLNFTTSATGAVSSVIPTLFAGQMLAPYLLVGATFGVFWKNTEAVLACVKDSITHRPRGAKCKNAI
ncbi:MAG: Ig-like domain repeat protein, partial [Nitrososphaerota archaeon]|nr:Ig-like domain repeat protein [Nitrososphaerota archaeon]